MCEQSFKIPAGSAAGSSLAGKKKKTKKPPKKPLELNLPAVPRPYLQHGGAVPSLPGEVGSTAGAHRSPSTVTLIADPKRRLQGQADIWHATGTAARRGGRWKRWLEGRSWRRTGREGEGQSQELLKLRGKTLNRRKEQNIMLSDFFASGRLLPQDVSEPRAALVFSQNTTYNKNNGCS